MQKKPPVNTSINVRPLIFAHRGSTILAPENTATAFDLALSFGSDILETDVRLTKDGVVVVFHDNRVDRTTNAQGKVRDFTFKQLKQLDAAYRFTDLQGIRYADRGISIMSLNELFARYPKVGINIDIKDNCVLAAAAVADCIHQNPHNQPINVGSFHGPIIRHFRSLQTGVSTAATRGEVAHLLFNSPRSRNPDYQCLQIPASYRGIPLAGTSFIKRVQAKGLSINYWTINETDQMRWLLNKSVDGIVTDRPDLACQIRNEST